MTTTIVNQLEGAQRPDMVDANSLSLAALMKLADAADLLVQANSATQPKLMAAFEVGMLRTAAEINTSEQMEVRTDSFSGSAYRFTA